MDLTQELGEVRNSGTHHVTEGYECHSLLRMRLDQIRQLVIHRGLDHLHEGVMNQDNLIVVTNTTTTKPSNHQN